MPVPTTRRRTSVHDFSTRRLRPDGTRVSISSPSRGDLYYSRTRHTGRDIRGNRVAQDAVSLGVVPKRPVMREDVNDEVQNTKPRGPRRRKRGRIDDDHVEFLGSSISGARRITSMSGETTIDANGKEEMMNWPVPSSDLLKCVHHFASQYYSARGLLTDRSREYRREVRQRKSRDVLAQAAAAGVACADADANSTADDPPSGDEEEEIDFGQEVRHHEGVVKDSGVDKGKGTPSESVPDMYRAFDGPALMAIGMLLQEHISTLLKPNVPLGWEEDTEAAGFLPEDRSVAVLDNENTDNIESEKSDEE